jgi:hypothetical protein
MSAIARKINIGVATCAMAAAATLTPVTVAHAQPAAAPISVLGGTAGALSDPDCETVASTPCATSFAGATALPTPGGIVRSIFQNDLWWIGQANPNAPTRSPILVFTPLTLVPGFLKPLYGWFTQNLNFEACLFGATLTIGAYGKTTLSVGRGCN